MKVHARLSPGIAAPGQDVEIRVHLPRRLAGVTLKLWELDTFIDRKGEAKRDPSGDVLLAQWDGDLEPGDGKTANDVNYVKFVKHQETIACAGEDADRVFRVRVRLPGANDAVEVPIASEKTELTARGISLALSVEKGGTALFKTKSSCVAQMSTTTLTFEHHRFSQRNEAGDFHSDADHDKHEELHAHQWVAFGLKSGEGVQEKLEVVGCGYLNARGLAVDSDAPEAQALVIRKDRPLYAYIHERRLDLPKGVSKIPLALCESIGDFDSVVVQVPEQGDLLEVRVAEIPVQFGERRTFATDISTVGAESDANEEHDAAWGIAARRFQRRT